jgi:Protein of unknown function (DUF4058)
MPSPFPGVDPYLEQSGRWPEFHNRVVTYACDAINDRLPGRYIACIDEQFRLVEAPEIGDKVIRPDVAIKAGRPAGGVASTGGLAATLEPVTRTLPTEFAEVRETRVEIRRVDDARLVTVIELLSPSNKVEPGCYDYDVKRRALFYHRVNLVEIDLLLAGRRLPMSDPLPRADYYALVARGPKMPVCSVYAWTVRMLLPTVPIPLLDPDPDVPLDLAAVVAMAYDRGRYARTIDYGAPLALPLDPDDRAWAEAQARGAEVPERRDVR